MRLFPSQYSSVKEAQHQSNGEIDGSVDGRTHVYLNVYDLTPINNYLYWFGLGIFHSGIEVHGMEYAFGAHDYPSSGVFEVEPKSCPGFIFRRSVWLGTTDMSRSELRSFIEDLAGRYHGDMYHLIVKNCNHFTDDVCMHLTGKPIPGWVNRLARLGSFCDCFLPESMQVTSVRHLPAQVTYSAVVASMNTSMLNTITIASMELLFISHDIIDIYTPEDGSGSYASTNDDIGEEDADRHLLITPNTELAHTVTIDKPLGHAKDVL